MTAAGDLAVDPPGIAGVVVRTRWWSARVHARAVAVGAGLAAACVIVGGWSVSVGEFAIPLREVAATLLGGGSPDSEFIVESLRLPRVLTGLMVGAAFGISGAIFQSLARNPLGSPDIVGFNHGAALGAVFMIVSVAGASTLQVAAGAVAGGVGAGVLVYVLAWRGGVQGSRLILVGIGVGFTAAATAEYLITRGRIEDVQRAAIWLTGSLNGRGWEHVRPVGFGLALLGPAAVVGCRQLRLLELGDDAAAALGVRVGRARLALVLVGIALASLATASAGPIAFLALMAAPIARRMVRSPGVTLVPAALVGALVTVTADLVARRAIAPIELPVGVATAVVGAPYLLWLLTREIKAGAM